MCLALAHICRSMAHRRIERAEKYFETATSGGETTHVRTSVDRHGSPAVRNPCVVATGGDSSRAKLILSSLRCAGQACSAAALRR